MTTPTTFTKRTNSPFRADFVGSFLRPAELANARNLHRKGLIDDLQLKQVEDKCIIELIAKQKAHGLKAITDGEFRRSYWHLDFMWGLNGIEHITREHGYLFVGIESRNDYAVLKGKISGENHPFVEHFKFIQQFAKDDPSVIARQTVPSPSQVVATLINFSNSELNSSWKEFYQSEEELIADLGKAYQQVFADLYAAGCRSIQIDDCSWSSLLDPEKVKTYQSDIKHVANLLLKANNLALENKPEDLVITTHLCRGNYRSHYFSSGPYDSVAPYVFAKENVDAFYLEYDDERSGSFEALKFIPEGKQVVLGVITSKKPELEDLDKVVARIQEASQYVPLDNLCVSPQCGFASTEEGNDLTEQQQWDKIDLVVKAAQKVWG
ncbi:5-methyltetrahydropteroyltriglutamate--homocysteine S-methyltransferase [Anaerobiospirillum sp. NML120448]|uniref:5-methyltetrahydropteroyltriglutamate-- homocysteine S-methyltransferase n=1 Tax=Anaerobiospirillum sp. NML120448 TaxID=2932816 RepID=UPI001FF40E83|nr:5-methyltetrahydropteroyltriglutamate--homocysteine S-methyltransferase [Anaerobiospirillum sp. NML120448]MCK0514631.1 5-methyltetrahydropteroyltriglutamate--homocysteine S-methyltransferase [Anaerobiospirillum sp. NML120448]